MKEEKAIEQFIRIQMERPLKESERLRLNDILRESPEALDIWLDHCEMETWLAASGDMISGESLRGYPVPSGRVQGTLSKQPARKRAFILLSIAAALGVLAIVGSQISQPSPESDSVTAEVEKPSLSPQENYEKVVANIPTVASKQRPPTGFVNASHIPSEEVDFNNDIRPILADNCFHCHGPDGESRKAKLRLDTEEGASKVIEAGDSSSSEIMVRLFENDPDEVMPPPDFHKELTDREKELLKIWIDSGAPWDKHWAFEKIEQAKIEGDNPIDFFIHEKHIEKRLKANPEADKYALARRAALDITGLPPTPAQLASFLEDDSADAYEKFVDNLLASPHYGEHRARFWLDAGRYGDTHGMHLDNFREMWLYRDWVIDAFNSNQPFDQFTIEQLAGDLLPNPTKPQLIATGFVRNNSSTSEGGSIPEELKVRYMSDRTETMATVFLGLTAGCAACHDHKYDPISQKEFYQLGAFFNNASDPPMDGNMRSTLR